MFIGGKCSASMYHVKVKLKLFFCSVPLNPQLEDLLLRMLIKDPIERITIKGIKVGMVVKKSSYNRVAKAGVFRYSWWDPNYQHDAWSGPN